MMRELSNGLKAELPAYLAATEEQKIKWWHDHKDRLPHWAAGAAILGCSRKPGVFAIIFQSSFNDQQEHALVDDLQANVMTQYNKR